MLGRLHDLIIDCSRTWWKFLLVATVQVGTLLMLQRISNNFPDVAGGWQPFDMQNDLQPDEIYTQLEAYTPQAFDLYTSFQLIDFVFPAAAALMLASACAFLLRYIATDFYQQIYDRKLFLLLLAPAIFDYLENIFLFWVVNNWPEQSNAAATLAVAAKLGKLATLISVFVLTGVLLVTAILMWIVRKSRARKAG